MHDFKKKAGQKGVHSHVGTVDTVEQNLLDIGQKMAVTLVTRGEPHCRHTEAEQGRGYSDNNPLGFN